MKLSERDLYTIRGWLDANRERTYPDFPERIEHGWGQGDVLAAHEELYAATEVIAGKPIETLKQKAAEVPLSLTAAMAAQVIPRASQ